VRDYLRAHAVEFDDRNIRHSTEAREELLALTDDLVVPTLLFAGRRIIGFDPEALDDVIAAYHSGAA
jgi:glutaredoxin